MRTSAIPIILLVLLSVTFVYTPASAAPDKLVVITPIGAKMTDPLTTKFSEWYKAKIGRDVTVEFIRGGTPVLFARIQAWAGKPDADIFWGGSPDMYDTLLATALLQGYKSPEAAALPDEIVPGMRLKHPDGYWYVTSFYGLGVIFNEELLSRLNLPIPKTWSELLDPKYRGHITFTTPAKSGTMHNLVELFLQRRGEAAGWSYWRQLAANVGFWSGRSFDVFLAVKQAEAAIGVAQAEDFAVSARLEGLRVKYSYMDMNTMILSPLAILKGATNLPVAEAFMDYILTADAQRLSITTGFIPSRPDVKFSDVAATSDRARLMKEILGADSIWELRAKLQPLNYTLQAARYGTINTIFDTTIVQVWGELKSAWFTIEAAAAEVDGLVAEGFDPKVGLETIDRAKAAFGAGNYSLAKTIALTAARNVRAAAIQRLFELEQGLEQQTAALQQALAVIAQLEQRTAKLEQQAQSIPILESDLTTARAEAANNFNMGIGISAASAVIVGAAVFLALRRRLEE